MNPQNLDLLQSQESLQKLQGVQEDLSRRVGEGDLQQEEADDQWRELLQETLEIEGEPLPRSALRTVEVSVADLKALEWMIEDQPPEDDTATE